MNAFPPERLTPREREVLQLIAAGLNTKQIAASLGISFKTAVTHRTHLMQKLNLHSVAAVTRYALQQQALEREREAVDAGLWDQLRCAEKDYRSAAEAYAVAIEAARTKRWRVDADGEQALNVSAIVQRDALEKYRELLKRLTDILVSSRHSG